MSDSANIFDSVATPPPVIPEKPPLTVERAAQRLQAIRNRTNRIRWANDPVLWVQERLGETPWSAQKKILRAIKRFRRVSVKSCHEVGKSYIAARVAGWWIDTHRPGEAFVITSAPTASQVRTILWREIGRVHARGNLGGRTNTVEWIMEVIQPESGLAKEEQVALGRKPDDYNPTAFQGIHAPFVLVILDESCGIGPGLREAVDSLIANDNSKLLEIGNPDFPNTEFHKNCKPGSGHHVISICAFDSPNFTGEPMPQFVLDQLIGRTYVEEKRKKWARNWYWVDKDGKRITHEPGIAPPNGIRVVCPEGANSQDTNPMWQSKVLGEFPEKAEDGNLIPMSWIIAAQQRELEPKESDPNELGVDVGRGGDASCIAHRRGPRVRIIHEDHQPDTMLLVGNTKAKLDETKASRAKIDEIGIGAGVVDRGVEQGFPFEGVNVGCAAKDTEHYINLRAELYWLLRERFESGEVDLDADDEDTAGELVELKYQRMSNGKIKIESKDEMAKRGVPSPNRAEAVMLAFADPPRQGGVLSRKLTW